MADKKISEFTTGGPIEETDEIASNRPGDGNRKVFVGSMAARDDDEFLDLANVDIDGTLAANSDTKVASQKAGKTYADTKVAAALFDAHTVLAATADNTPAALTISEQTVLGRATGGNIAALAIDSDISSTSGSDDTIPSAKAAKAYADTKIAASLFDAHTILAATVDNTPAALTVADQTVVGRAGGNIAALAIDSDISTTSGSDDTIPSAKAAKAYADTKVAASLFDAHTILYATTDNTPVALTVAAQTVVGRAGGNIAALAIDSDISTTSGSDDTIPSAKAVKTYADTKLASTIDVPTALTPSADQNDYNTGAALTSASVASLIRIAATAVIKITGILATSAADGKEIIWQNTTDPLGAGASIIIFERESASSAAANRISFAPMGGFPLILGPGEEIKFRYSTATSRWVLGPSTRNGSPGAFFDIYGDMFATAPYNPTASGTGAGAAVGNIISADATQKAVGVSLAGSGTTATGYCYTGLSASGLITDGGSMLFLGRFLPDTLSDGSNTYKLNIGLHDAAGTGTVVDGIFYEYDQATSTAWRSCTVANSVATKNTITGFTVSISVGHYLGIFVNGDGSKAYFFYSTDGEVWTIFATTHTTNIPTGTARVYGMSFGITKSVGITSRFACADWMGARFFKKRGA